MAAIQSQTTYYLTRLVQYTTVVQLTVEYSREQYSTAGQYIQYIIVEQYYVEEQWKWSVNSDDTLQSNPIQ